MKKRSAFTTILLLPRLSLKKQSMKIRETPAFTSTKEQLSKEKHPLNSKAGSASLFAPPDPSSPAGRVWETLEAWSRHEFLADASEDD